MSNIKLRTYKENGGKCPLYVGETELNMTLAEDKIPKFIVEMDNGETIIGYKLKSAKPYEVGIVYIDNEAYNRGMMKIYEKQKE